MPVAITGAELVSCLGDRRRTYEALLAGRDGCAPLRHIDGKRLGVHYAYQVDDGDPELPLRASGWLARCVAAAVRQAGLDPDRERIAVVVGTGLRELRAVERWSADGADLRLDDLHFARAVRDVLPLATEVITLANACSASGHALAVGQDLLDAGEASAVVVAGCDSLTESMLAMVGLVAPEPTPMLRPFDAERAGVLLGDGAAAVVIQREDGAARGARTQARLLGVGMSCDAHHDTAPDLAGITAAIRDAHGRAGIAPEQVDLVVAHGTGTALNDPTESAALGTVFAAGPGPLVTGIKGAVGHTSGAAALMSLVVAVDALRTGQVPPIVGLRTPLEEAAGLRLVAGGPVGCRATVAQVDSFGFGGVNAVAVLAAAEA